MKCKHVVFAMAGMGLCLRLFAEENAPLPPELVALQKRHQLSVDTATKPIRDRYATTLQSLLRSTTQKGDLPGALAVQSELNLIIRSAASNAAIQSAIAGTWKFRWGTESRTRTIKEDGTFSAAEDGRVGKWSVEKDKVVLTWPGGGNDVMFFPINPNGTKGHADYGFDFVATKK